jgi:hypothetical protein
MRRSAIPESRVSLSQRIANRSSRLNVAESGEDVNHAFPEDSWAAWSCLLGSFLMMFPSFGLQTASMEFNPLCITTDFIQSDQSRTI